MAIDWPSTMHLRTNLQNISLFLEIFFLHKQWCVWDKLYCSFIEVNHGIHSYIIHYLVGSNVIIPAWRMPTINFYRNLTCVCNTLCKLAGNKFPFILCDLCAQHLETKPNGFVILIGHGTKQFIIVVVRIPRNLDKYDGDLAANMTNQPLTSHTLVSLSLAIYFCLFEMLLLLRNDNHLKCDGMLEPKRQQ